jgi:gamma-butyrobetaine dioxygenase
MFRSSVKVLKVCNRRFNSIKINSFDKSAIAITIDGETLLFNNVFLRDACQLPESVDTYSKQKLFTTCQVLNNLSIKSAVVDNDNVIIDWDQQGTQHQSTYTKEFLKAFRSKVARKAGKNFDKERIYWNNAIISEHVDSIQQKYQDYLTDFNPSVFNLNSLGLAFVNDIPKPTLSEMTEQNTKEWPVSKLAEKFGYIKKTFYGTLFDVKNVAEATNIAYTNVFLPLHMDLLYYESPPGLQLLHSIDNSTLGGENIFVDSFLAAQQVREVDPNAYYALTQVPITYHYNNNGEYYYYQRPLIVEQEGYLQTKSYRPDIKEVNYAPPFQGPFEVGVVRCLNHPSTEIGSGSHHASLGHFLFKDFLRGFQIFEDFINDPANQYKVKLTEGTCVIFDNRRILHSREEFSDSNGGKRWLMGAYVDGDSFRSKLRVGKRTANQSL